MTTTTLTRFVFGIKFPLKINTYGCNVVLKNLSRQCADIPFTTFTTPTNRSRTFSSITRPGVIYYNRGLATEATKVIVPTLNRSERDGLVEQMKTYYRNNYILNYNKELLNDIPAWLDGMGLKGLAPHFEGKRWEEIIELTDWEQLRDLGITRPPYRKRLIRNFWMLKRVLANEEGIELKEKVRTKSKHIPDHNEKIDFAALEDLPTMFNGVYDGFGFFAPHFEGRNWKEIINMTWEDLEMLGVRSRYVRSRMIGFFWSIKRALAAENGDLVPAKPERLRIFKKYDALRNQDFPVTH